MRMLTLTYSNFTFEEIRNVLQLRNVTESVEQKREETGFIREYSKNF